MYYYLLVFAIGLKRLLELGVAQRNAAWSIAHGGKEFGRNHYPAMVSMHVLHADFVRDRSLEPAPARSSRGWDGRWSRSSRPARWSARGASPCLAGTGTHGSSRYRARRWFEADRTEWLHHPNYTAVAAEVVALPLVHLAWLTAVAFSIANALVLTVRIRAENTALGYAGWLRRWLSALSGHAVGSGAHAVRHLK